MGRLIGLDRLSLVAPDEAIGWTHVWGGQQEQIPLDDGQAVLLTVAGLVEWSGIYRVYRPAEGVTMQQVREAVNV